MDKIRISERSIGKTYTIILMCRDNPDMIVITPKGKLTAKEFLEKYDKKRECE